MAKMIFCTGEGCPIMNLCARNTRVPANPEDGYEVFQGVPYEGEEVKPYGCRYYWPEAHIGMTEVPVDPAQVITMMGQKKFHGITSGKIIDKPTPDPSEITAGSTALHDQPKPTDEDFDEPENPDFAAAAAAIPKDEPAPVDWDAVKGTGETPPKAMMSAGIKPLANPDPSDLGDLGAGFGTKQLWPTAEEQNTVFDMLCRTESDIIAFDKVSRENRSTNPRDVWLVLDTILARMKKMIYGHSE